MKILQKPLVTEKMNEKSEKLNVFGFIVDRKANKIQIKQAVEEMYNVSVVSVNTMRYAGKSKSRYTKGGMVTGSTNSYKKAIVKLAEGDYIDFYSNI